MECIKECVNEWTYWKYKRTVIICRGIFPKVNPSAATPWRKCHEAKSWTLSLALTWASYYSIKAELQFLFHEAASRSWRNPMGGTLLREIEITAVVDIRVFVCCKQVKMTDDNMEIIPLLKAKQCLGEMQLQNLSWEGGRWESSE